MSGILVNYSYELDPIIDDPGWALTFGSAFTVGRTSAVPPNQDESLWSCILSVLGGEGPPYTELSQDVLTPGAEYSLEGFFKYDTTSVSQFNVAEIRENGNLLLALTNLVDVKDEWYEIKSEQGGTFKFIATGTRFSVRGYKDGATGASSWFDLLNLYTTPVGSFTQEGDTLLRDNNGLSDMRIEGGVTEMTTGVETAYRLCLTGGNLRDSGTPDTKYLEWVGNEDEPEERQLRSRFQAQLRGKPLCSASIKDLKDAAIFDITRGFGTLLKNLTVKISIISINSVRVSSEIELIDGSVYVPTAVFTR